MDKLQLIIRLAELNPQLKTKEVELAVKVVLDALCGSLAKGGRIEIRGFGSFSLRQIQSPQKRNPKIGGLIKAPAKYVPQFKPAKELCKRVCDSGEAKSNTVTHPASHHIKFPDIPTQLNPAVTVGMDNMTHHA